VFPLELKKPEMDIEAFLFLILGKMSKTFINVLLNTMRAEVPLPLCTSLGLDFMLRLVSRVSLKLCYKSRPGGIYISSLLHVVLLTSTSFISQIS